MEEFINVDEIKKLVSSTSKLFVDDVIESFKDRSDATKDELKSLSKSVFDAKVDLLKAGDDDVELHFLTREYNNRVALLETAILTEKVILQNEARDAFFSRLQEFGDAVLVVGKEVLKNAGKATLNVALGSMAGNAGIVGKIAKEIM